MPSQTTLRICDPLGNFLIETAAFLEIGNNPGLRYVLNCGQVGALVVTLPPELNPLLLKDGRMHVMRSVNGGPAKREGESCFLIRRWEYSENYTVVTALHANDILRRRYAWYAYIDASSDTDPYDDMIKFVFNTNNIPDVFFTPSRLGGTTQFDISSYISVEPNLSVLASVFKRFGYRNVLDVITEIGDASLLAGRFLTAEVTAPTESTLTLRTYIDQRGVDRRISTGSGLLFTAVRGNLENPVLTVDATEEITAALAGGQYRNDGSLFVASAEDTARMGESPFGRIETFIDSTAETTTELQSDADAGVQNGVPVIQVVADLVETDQCIRGVHFDFGDYVTVQVRDQQYDMRLNILEVQLTGNGERTIARFEYHGS